MELLGGGRCAVDIAINETGNMQIATSMSHNDCLLACSEDPLCAFAASEDNGPCYIYDGSQTENCNAKYITQPELDAQTLFVYKHVVTGLPSPNLLPGVSDNLDSRPGIFYDNVTAIRLRAEAANLGGDEEDSKAWIAAIVVPILLIVLLVPLFMWRIRKYREEDAALTEQIRAAVEENYTAVYGGALGKDSNNPAFKGGGKTSYDHEDVLPTPQEDEGDDIYALDAAGESGGGTKSYEEPVAMESAPPPRPRSITKQSASFVAPPRSSKPGNEAPAYPATLRRVSLPKPEPDGDFGVATDELPPPPPKKASSAPPPPQRPSKADSFSGFGESPKPSPGPPPRPRTASTSVSAPPPRPRTSSATVNSLLPESDFVHGVLDRKVTESMLQQGGGVDGTFLVRTKGAGYVLSMCAHSKCEHHMVNLENSVFTVNNKSTSVPCLTLPELVKHLTNETDGITVKLTQHVPPVNAASGMAL